MLSYPENETLLTNKQQLWGIPTVKWMNLKTFCSEQPASFKTMLCHNSMWDGKAINTINQQAEGCGHRDMGTVSQ